MMHRQSRQCGFTLLELLVASAISAALGLSLYAALTIGFNARRTAHDQLRAPREVALVLDMLEQDFQALLPPSGILSGPFIGMGLGTVGEEADAVEFHALTADPSLGDHPLSDGMSRVRLVLRTDVDPPQLVRQVQRNLLATFENPVEEHLVATDVRSFMVRYYDGDAWRTDWDSTLLGDVLPLAVELTVEVDRPTTDNPEGRYRVSRLIPLSTGAMPAPEFFFGGGF